MRINSVLVVSLLLCFTQPCLVSELPIYSGSDPATEANQPVYSKNPEANALYIQGLEYLSKGRPIAGGSLLNGKKALKLFRQATQKDPQFALAYIGQADALDAISFSTAGSKPPGSVYREQEAAALKAAELDDSLPQVHVQLAEIYQDNEYDWPKTEKELKRVIELTPNVITPHIRYGLFLGTMGKFEEAEAQLKLAQTIDPKSSAPNRAMLRLLYWEHKDDAAIAQGQEALSKDNSLFTHLFIAFAYLHQGQLEKGVEEMKVASALGDAATLASLAYAYAVAGDKKELADTLERFNHHPARNNVPYSLAGVYAALGDHDRAIKLIERDYRQRSSQLTRLKVDPVMDPLREDSRFKKLLSRMNFEN